MAPVDDLVLNRLRGLPGPHAADAGLAP